LSYNLLKENWIPVERQSGTRERIAPPDVTSRYSEDPVLRVASPRPDFDGALTQFLVGLLQTEHPPSGELNWEDAFRDPPSPDALGEALSSATDAFELTDPETPFLQDPKVEDRDPRTFARLLIDAPGENTRDQNRDHFIKAESDPAVCPACAAAALYTMQANAPSGGRGYLTSLRGGGPATTLLLGENLWETLWLNVLPEGEIEREHGLRGPRKPEKIYPWLGVVPDEKATTTPDDLHPLHVFWSMSRRLLLDFEETKEGACELCGTCSQHLIEQYRTHWKGFDYDGAWLHPLTPYNRLDDEPPSSVKARRGFNTYRHWLGLVLNDPNEGRQPALAVHRYVTQRARNLVPDRPRRLWGFGYDMDQMKAQGWQEGTMPVFAVDEDHLDDLQTAAQRLVEAADYLAARTYRAVRDALLAEPSDADRRDSLLRSVEEDFWTRTEPEFYQVLEQVTRRIEENEPVDALLAQWFRTLRGVALGLFDQCVRGGRFGAKRPRQIVEARRKLQRCIHGNKIRNLLDLSRSDLRDEERAAEARPSR
jgi:CRISPR system Cascade subunit CasA